MDRQHIGLTGQTPKDLGTGPRRMDEHPNGQFSLLPRLPSQITQGHRARRLALGSDDGPSILGHRPGLTPLGNDGLLDRFIMRRDVGGDLVQTFPDHLGDEQEVVIVHDDQVAGFVQLGDSFGEQEVGLLVCLPRWVGSGQGDGRVLPEQVVEQGPES